MKRVLTAVVLVPLVLLIVFKAPIWIFAPVVGLFIALGLKEYLGIVESAGIKAIRWPTYILGLLPVIAILADTLPLVLDPPYHHRPISFLFEPNMLSIWAAVCAAAPLIYGALLVFRKDMRGGLASVAASMLGLLYVALPLSLLIDLRGNPLQCFLIVFILFSVWAGDIAAYYVGKKFGRHKLAPVVSPNKSWEGAIASSFASLGVAALVFKYQYDIPFFFAGPFGIFWGGYDVLRTGFPWAHVILLGVFTNVAAQFGDLFESALKRGAGVKDSGALLPGHGGILDRIDALLFAIPFVVCYIGVAQIVGKLLP